MENSPPMSQELLPNENVDNQLEQLQHGVLIDDMGVAVKQWFLTLNWQRTKVSKNGIINRLRKIKQTIDLDLSCLLCNRYGEVVERVWFKNVRDQAESVRHHGDELLGTQVEHDKQQDFFDIPDQQLNQERMTLYLSRIPNHIFHVVMVLSSYTDNVLSVAEQGHCQLVDDEGNVIFDVYLSNLPSDCQAIWLATLTRSGESWRFQTLNQPLYQHRLQQFEQQISNEIIRMAS